ncbi:MAG TPA: acetylornithine deacetylase [Porphyromonadaceae bacterium]|nr:acetylornithine deacetylase [Porphyromonadaceae bacterium]
MIESEIYAFSVETLKKLISIPSVSREESNVADFLFSLLKEKGFSPKRIGNNLWCIGKYFAEGKPTLLLNSHLDTVKPITTWSKKPFFPEETEDKIYGLGSNDAGASLVSLIAVFELLERREQSYNLILGISAEEEVSGKNGIGMLLSQLPIIDVGIIGEPTELKMAIAEKGLLVLDCTSYGKSGHAALNNGENAIYKAIEDIEIIKENDFFQPSTLLGNVHFSVTMIDAGTQHNVIPDKCHFVVDIRTNELYSNQEVLECLKDKLSSTITPRSLHLNSSSISREHPLVKRGIELGLTTFGSPTLSDKAQMPFPTLKLGPGSSKRSHTADEYIEKKEILQGIECYFSLLDGLNIIKE